MQRKQKNRRMKTTAPCGSWESPISANMILLDRLKLWEPHIANGHIYWLQYFSERNGSRHIMRRSPSGEIRQMTHDGYNIRTRVHEYGGGAYTVAGDSIVFVNFEDQRIYRQVDTDSPVPVTPMNGMRYADFTVDEQRQRLICVREDHNVGKYPENTLVQLSLTEESDGRILFSGTDFVAYPRISPDSKQLAWISWNNPSMPWNENTLWLADFDESGELHNKQQLNVGQSDSILDPQWSPEGILYFMSDRSGWWNLYRWRENNVEPVVLMELDCADPPWELGQQNYGFLSPDVAIMRAEHPDGDRLYKINLKDQSRTPISTPLVTIDCMAARDGQAVLAGTPANDTAALLELTANSDHCTLIHHPAPLGVDHRFVSDCRALAYPTDGGLTAHGYWIPPKNPHFQCPAGEKPPVIVCAHGGPTWRFHRAFTAAFNFWTSRGVGIFLVNYGGSSGYGREYRERLDGNYGVVDVNDTLAAARYLAKSGLADPERIAVRGSSAGGYIVLGCLAWGKEFAAGINYFGISDVGAWARDTHKHEFHYLDRLLAPYTGNEALYDQRSPIRYVSKFSAPLLVLQGLEDRVVPPNQSEFIVEELEKLGKPVAYVAFEGEYHGFSKPESNLRAVNAELNFLGRVFGFTPADKVEHLEIKYFQPEAQT